MAVYLAANRPLECHGASPNISDDLDYPTFVAHLLDAQLTATDIQNNNETKLTAAHLASAHLLGSVLFCFLSFSQTGKSD